MKNVSYDFKEIIHNGGPFYAYAKVVLADGQKLELNSERDFLLDGNGYSESGGASSFPLGIAAAKTMRIALDNSEQQYSEYDFYYARITLYTEAELPNGTTEQIKEGTFTVTSPVANGDTIEIEAVNDMYKTNITYSPSIAFPATTMQILQDVCKQCNLVLGSPSFTNQNFIVESIEKDLLCREVIGYIAQIAGGNAVCDENNRLLIKTYDLSIFESQEYISGGEFGETAEDTTFGGDFGETVQDIIFGGEFGDNDDYHVLSNFPEEPEISTDDVVITGLSTTYKKVVNGEEQELEYLYGKEGYVLSIDNPLISGKEQEALGLIGKWIVGIEVRPFTATHTAYPTAEFMDPAYVVDTKNNVYETFLTDIEFEYMSTTAFSNSTESPARNNADYFSQAGAAYRKAREELSKQKTEWEKAMEDLSSRLENSSGLYMTAEKQSDGSSIYYMHDKPTKEQSKIVWKMTAEAMAVSTDGGKTWNAGLTVDGTLIAKILNAIGINADWINSGTVSADRIYGGTLTLGGKDNRYGTLQVLDSDGEVRGVWDYLTLKLKDKNGSVAQPAIQVISSQNNNETKISGGYFSVKYGQKTMLYISDDLNYVRTEKLQSYGFESVGDAKISGNLTVALNAKCNSMDASSANISGTVNTRWVKASDAIWAQNFFVNGGGTKAKISKTQNFGDRVQHCYETSSPYFGDIGQGYLDTNGVCRIFIEDVFIETINTECEYQVFLQKEGQGDIWVEEKETLYFIVRGTPGLKFAWELKGIQRGFEARRLDRVEVESDERKDIDYALNAAKFYEEIQHNNYAGEGYSFYMNYINDLRRQYYA
jgi:hypothetical protein